MTDHSTPSPDENPLAGNPLAGLDLGGMLDQVQALQQQMTEAQEAHAAQVITGSSGGGKVTVEVQGRSMELNAVTEGEPIRTGTRVAIVAVESNELIKVMPA